jgi:hypothetical protein
VPRGPQHPPGPLGRPCRNPPRSLGPGREQGGLSLLGLGGEKKKKKSKSLGRPTLGHAAAQPGLGSRSYGGRRSLGVPPGPPAPRVAGPRARMGGGAPPPPQAGFSRTRGALPPGPGGGLPLPRQGGPGPPAGLGRSPGACATTLGPRVGVPATPLALGANLIFFSRTRGALPPGSPPREPARALARRAARAQRAGGRAIRGGGRPGETRGQPWAPPEGLPGTPLGPWPASGPGRGGSPSWPGPRGLGVSRARAPQGPTRAAAVDPPAQGACSNHPRGTAGAQGRSGA